MNYFHKLRAGSLQFVVFIGAVIAVLLLSFVLLSYSHLFFHKKTNALVAMVSGNDTFLQRTMNKQENRFAVKRSNTAKEGERITNKSRWGLFEKYEVVATGNESSFTSIALVGIGLDEQSPALYLRDRQRPLILAGNTKIQGLTALPEQGVRPGNIAGNSYLGNHLVYGKTVGSDTLLPKLSRDLSYHIKALCTNPVVSGTQLRFRKKEQYQNSFSKPTINITGDYIRLAQTQLTGNIRVVASREIVVTATTTLTDVVLIAPKIKIEDQFEGTFQAFASKRITVGKRCLLKYPSALVVHTNSGSNTQNQQQGKPQIGIGEGSTVKGVVLYQNSTENQLFFPQLKIATNSIVVGQVYCERNLELKGAVFGSIYTDSFMALANGSIYQNHLFNGKISLPQLAPQFVGLEFQKSNTPKTIAKWLY